MGWSSRVKTEKVGQQLLSCELLRSMHGIFLGVRFATYKIWVHAIKSRSVCHCHIHLIAPSHSFGNLYLLVLCWIPVKSQGCTFKKERDNHKAANFHKRWSPRWVSHGRERKNSGFPDKKYWKVIQLTCSLGVEQRVRHPSSHSLSRFQDSFRHHK